MIPIANKVAVIFPHNTAYSLSALLAEKEAVCVGKIEVLLIVSRFLGLQGRGQNVFETLDNEFNHMCFELSLFSKNDCLVIDANYDSGIFLKDYDDKQIEELIDKKIRNREINPRERKKAIADYKKYRDNAKNIPENSQVLIYTITNTGKRVEKNYRPENYEIVRLNPFTGQREIWRANIPYPHPLVAPDKDTNISSGYYYNLGFLYHAQKEWEKAEECYKKALEINPNYVKVYYNLGVLYHDQEKWEEAEECYKKVLEINPNNARAHYNLGVLYFDLRKKEEAKQHFRKCVHICVMMNLIDDPRYKEIYTLALKALYDI